LITNNLEYIVAKLKPIIVNTYRFTIVAWKVFVIQIEYKGCIVVGGPTTAAPALRSEAPANGSYLSFD
jgi:hypothetical protein